MTRPLGRVGLRSQLLLLLTAAILPLVGLVLWSAAQQRESARAQAEAEAFRIATTISARQRDWLNTGQQLLAGVAKLLPVGPDDAEMCSSVLATLRTTFPAYANFWVDRPDGTVLCSGAPVITPWSDAGSAWFQGASASRAFAVGEFRVNPTTSVPVVEMGLPVLSSDGTVLAVIGTALDLTWLNRDLTTAPVPDGAVLTVVDRAGVVLARSAQSDQWVGQSIADTPLARALATDAGGQATLADLDGTARLTAFVPLGPSPAGVTVLAGLPASQIDAAANRTLVRALVVLVVVVVLILTVAWLASGVLVRRLHELLSTTRRLSAGELSARTEIESGPSEIVELAQAFDGMATSLAAQQAATGAARAEMRAVLDAADEAMVLVSPDRHLLTVNRRLVDLFEIPAAQLLGRRFDELQPEVTRIFADADQLAERVAGTAENPTATFSFDLRQQWPVVRDLRLASMPVRDESGHFRGRLYALRDVTHEREVERMKDEFVAFASHELRTPLTSIKGYADLLAEDDTGSLTADQREFIGVIQSNADRLVSLATDLLDLSRLDAGRLEVRRQPCDLRTAAESAASLLRAQMTQKEQAFTLRLATTLPAVAGDPGRLVQILTNLLSNAHKYTPCGGHITVCGDTDGADVRIVVQDTGVGLTQDEQARLFTRFYRANNQATRAATGTGLGLAITRALVEQHGGSISVASTPGVGTAFTVRLPVWSDQGPDGKET